MNSAQSAALEARRSGVAACVLDAMTDAEIAAAVGVHRHTVERDVRELQRRHEARNRVALALALERLRLAETFATPKEMP
jgi:DNA-binding NarL/FixJ family response regulator